MSLKASGAVTGLNGTLTVEEFNKKVPNAKIVEDKGLTGIADQDDTVEISQHSQWQGVKDKVAELQSAPGRQTPKPAQRPGPNASAGVVADYLINKYPGLLSKIDMDGDRDFDVNDDGLLTKNLEDAYGTKHNGDDVGRVIGSALLERVKDDADLLLLGKGLVHTMNFEGSGVWKRGRLLRIYKNAMETIKDSERFKKAALEEVP